MNITKRRPAALVGLILSTAMLWLISPNTPAAHADPAPVGYSAYAYWVDTLYGQDYEEIAVRPEANGYLVTYVLGFNEYEYCRNTFRVPAANFKIDPLMNTATLRTIPLIPCDGGSESGPTVTWKQNGLPSPTGLSITRDAIATNDLRNPDPSTKASMTLGLGPIPRLPI